MDFKSSHPNFKIDKKADSTDEGKSVVDASSLVTVLKDFFSLHPHFHPDTFLGDSTDFYRTLMNGFHFSKALIPYNPRNENSLKKVGYNLYSYAMNCPPYIRSLKPLVATTFNYYNTCQNTPESDNL